MSAAKTQSFSSLAALLAVLAISVPLGLGFLKDLHPAFDSLAHFRAHLASALALAALPLLFMAMWLQGFAALALAAAAFSTVLTAGGAQADNGKAEGPVYRLLHLNLRFDNAAPEKALSLIGRFQPDVVTLNEVSAMWREKLDLIAPRYPHRVICDSESPVGGVAILSRRPFRGDGNCFDSGRFAVARIDFGVAEAQVAALHLEWPWPFGQPAQIARLQTQLGLLGETALLAGDFNAATWSAAVDRIARAGGLALAPRIGPTWLHRTLPKALRAYAGLPIDHVMIKGGVGVRSAKTGPDAGSDHLPLLVEFTLEPPPAEPAVLEARRQAFSDASPAI